MSDIFADAAMTALRQALSGTDPKTGKPTAGTPTAATSGALGAIGGFVMTGESIKQSTPGIIEQAMETFKRYLAEPAYKLAEKFLDNLVYEKILSDATRKQLIETLSTLKAGSPLIVVGMVIALIAGYVKSVMTGSMALAEQNVFMGLRPTLPSVGDIIKAVFIDPTATEKWRDVARRSGLREDHLQMILKSAYSPLDASTIRDLYFRRGRDKDWATKRLKELALTDERLAEVMETWSIIPGPDDLIRMAVREAFSPDQVAALGLDADFPEEFSTWAEKVGLSDPWPRMYWRAHWQLPSAREGFEMLHRGVITEEQLSSLLKALDYAPVWHDRLKAIAYNVVTRVDARRLYAAGVYTEDDLKAAYRRMGYSPEDAESLTAWTKIEYAQGDKELTRAQIERAYVQHVIDRTEAERLLSELGYGRKRIGWLLDMAEYSARSDERSETIAAVKEAYLAGMMTQTEARDRLGREEIDAPYIESLITHWSTIVSAKRKLPSKSDLDKFLKAGLVSEGEYKAELRRLGYSADLADKYYRLNTAQ